MKRKPARPEAVQPPDAPPNAADDPVAFAIGVARLAVEYKATAVEVLDLRGLSNLADVFVLATGTSDRQMEAVLGAIEGYAETLGRSPFRPSNIADTKWMLADYVDVVVHLFDAEHRTYYDLDGLWGDAPRVEWEVASQRASAT
jgi:ribosome-associated protein